MRTGESPLPIPNETVENTSHIADEISDPIEGIYLLEQYPNYNGRNKRIGDTYNTILSELDQCSFLEHILPGFHL